MRRPRLQLALDLTDLEQAVAAATRVAAAVDVIEAGTLLCLAEGMHAVGALREGFADKIIVADVRIARAGRNIAEMAFSAGADWVTVVGEAPPETVEAAAKVARSHQGEIQIELNPDWTRDRAMAWRDLGVEQVIFHSTAEVEAVGTGWSASSLETVATLAEMGFRVTATGGIEPGSIASFAGIPVSVFIAGRAIVKAPDPLASARAFQSAIADTYG